MNRAILHISVGAVVGSLLAISIMLSIIAGKEFSAVVEFPCDVVVYQK